MADIKLSISSEELDDIYSYLYGDDNSTDLANITFDIGSIPCGAHRVPPAVQIFMTVFYMLIFLLAIPGNLVVGLVVGSSRHSLSPSDLFLFNLALADLLLAATLPLSAVSFLRGWIFGDLSCKLISMIVEINFYTSILLLVCISADRYMMVVHNATEGRGRSGGCLRLSWIACGCVWLLGFLLSVPVLVYSTSYSSMENSTILECVERYTTSSASYWRFATRLLRHLLGFLLPLGTMMVFYGVTIARLVQTRGFRKQRAMRVIIAVVTAFLLCWCPYHLVMMVDTLVRENLVDSGCHRRHEIDRALLATRSLGLLNCCINPVLYAFVGEKFRSNLMKLLRKRGIVERESISRSFSRSTSSTSQGNNNALT
uniref:G-protein coupled receptors family 1 profile domain-containing protein n=1 Tax=Astyanax mexicanus TaxID=7994 RepID=A0A8B9LUL2_ASTMX